MKKIRYEPFKGRVLFHTTYSGYFKENLHMFDALDFLAELTQHIQLAGKTWVMNRRLTKTKRSVTTHVNAHGPDCYRRCTRWFRSCVRSAVRL